MTKRVRHTDIFFHAEKVAAVLKHGAIKVYGDTEVKICAFKTSATGTSSWSLNDFTTLPLRKDSLVPIGLQTKCTTEAVCMQWQREKCLTLARTESQLSIL
jgi:hypothetical protein